MPVRIKNLSKFARSRRGKITISAAVAALIVIFWFLLFPAAGAFHQQTVTVTSGQTVSQIAGVLSRAGLINSQFVFKAYVFLRGWNTHLQAGTYTVPAGSPLIKIASIFANGQDADNDVTVVIPEGSNIWEIDQRLADAGLVTAGQFAKAYYLDEGYFFPDSYRFKKGSSMADIATTMRNNFNTQIGGLSPISPAGLQTIITIASIIEKEARDPQDMLLVSGVIRNRIADNMPLQIDATVAYGACLKTFLASNPPKDCIVSQVGVADAIPIDSAFNTYLNSGLPPRPISNPGENAIKAALNPTGSYLYYLTAPDGTFIFSKTSAEHEAARQKYLGL